MEVQDAQENCPICMSAMGPYLMEEDEIALLACRHRYHNTCISEWIQTATSCPYCRTEFQSVDVLQDPAGPIVRSYTVEPKIQEEQFTDGEVEEEDLPAGERVVYGPALTAAMDAGCQVCSSHEREDILMICDSCDECTHSFCLGLEDLPSIGPFFCPKCLAGDLDPQALAERCVIRTVASIRRSARRPRRTRSARRRRRVPEAQYDNWRAAWQRVASRAWTRLNAELEYQEEPEAGLSREQQDEIRSWRLRMERRPNYAAPVVDEPSVAPDPQTASLWAAFEQARNFSSPATTSMRRSRSRSHSQPRTGLNNGQSVLHTGSSQQRQKRPGARKRELPEIDLSASRKRTGSIHQARLESTNGSQPGFLSTLLHSIKESKPEDQTMQLLPHTRSISTPMSRSISPISSSFSRSPSPSSPSSSYGHGSPEESAVAAPHTPGTPQHQYSKLEISKLVSSQLKPLYKVTLTKEEFTSINRTITRRLFDANPLPVDENEMSTMIKNEVDSEVQVLK